MIINILKRTLFFIILIILQFSFIKNLPAPINLIDLVLIGLIFFGIIYDFRRVLIYALVIGLFVDITTPFFYGIYTISLIFTIVLVEAIYNRFITNRSLYSILALLIIGSISRHYLYFTFLGVWFFFSQKVNFFNQLFTYQDLLNSGWMILLNSIIATMMFLFIYFFSNKFKAILVR